MLAGFIFEQTARKKGYKIIAGVDEAGRGPLAGPVVAAAVIMQDVCPIIGITDSKKLTCKKRDILYNEIYAHAVSIGIGIVDPCHIDRMNILQASLFAMQTATRNLKPQPEFVLIDGNFTFQTHLPVQAIPKGDSKSISIAAASIIAKVTRDKLMDFYAHEYPEYGLAQHKGYPTKEHKEAIKRFGCSPIHRKSFKGVKEFV